MASLDGAIGFRKRNSPDAKGTAIGRIRW